MFVGQVITQLKFYYNYFNIIYYIRFDLAINTINSFWYVP